MNLSTLVSRTAARFRDQSGIIVTPEQWEDFINDAYMDAVSASPFWPFLENRATVTLAPGDAEGLLPADSWAVTAVHNVTDDFPLTPIDGRSAYRHWFPAPADSRGSPQFYRLRGRFLEVYPRPNQTTVLEADLSAPPAALTDLDDPIFPEQYHRALIDGALRRAYEDEGNLTQAQIHGQAFDAMVSRMLMDLLTVRTEHYPTPLDVG